MALARLATAKKALATLQAELEAYGACDPVKVEEKRRAVMLAREAALRHTGQVPDSPSRLSYFSLRIFFPALSYGKLIDCPDESRQLHNSDGTLHSTA
jgi:hypothetical protein